MTSNNNTGHSAEYFGASRDFWWNHDFLALMAQRLRLDQCTLALDVGCGIGHWGFTLARAVNPRAQWTGVDREPNWVRRAGERARDAGLAERFRFVEGTAQALPFHDASFDLVTCQTVLIHLPDPRVALREMQRVLRPGGRLLVVEPNNLVGHAL
ncbi:MAG: methyltransferase domain-containing protein, partial [Bdellovibrionales bacterium]|nr:methyltransferase domain-containing protein [Bdellovibrionales bacterium]